MEQSYPPQRPVISALSMHPSGVIGVRNIMPASAIAAQDRLQPIQSRPQNSVLPAGLPTTMGTWVPRQREAPALPHVPTALLPSPTRLPRVAPTPGARGPPMRASSFAAGYGGLASGAARASVVSTMDRTPTSSACARSSHGGQEVLGFSAIQVSGLCEMLRFCSGVALLWDAAACATSSRAFISLPGRHHRPPPAHGAPQLPPLSRPLGPVSTLVAIADEGDVFIPGDVFFTPMNGILDDAHAREHAHGHAHGHAQENRIRTLFRRVGIVDPSHAAVGAGETRGANKKRHENDELRVAADFGMLEDVLASLAVGIRTLERARVVPTTNPREAGHVHGAHFHAGTGPAAAAAGGGAATGVILDAADAKRHHRDPGSACILSDPHLSRQRVGDSRAWADAIQARLKATPIVPANMSLGRSLCGCLCPKGQLSPGGVGQGGGGGVACPHHGQLGAHVICRLHAMGLPAPLRSRVIRELLPPRLLRELEEQAHRRYSNLSLLLCSIIRTIVALCFGVSSDSAPQMHRDLNTLLGAEPAAAASSPLRSGPSDPPPLHLLRVMAMRRVSGLLLAWHTFLFGSIQPVPSPAGTIAARCFAQCVLTALDACERSIQQWLPSSDPVPHAGVAAQARVLGEHKDGEAGFASAAPPAVSRVPFPDCLLPFALHLHGTLCLKDGKRIAGNTHHPMSFAPFEEDVEAMGLQRPAAFLLTRASHLVFNSCCRSPADFHRALAVSLSSASEVYSRSEVRVGAKAPAMLKGELAALALGDMHVVVGCNLECRKGGQGDATRAPRGIDLKMGSHDYVSAMAEVCVVWHGLRDACEVAVAERDVAAGAHASVALHDAARRLESIHTNAFVKTEWDALSVRLVDLVEDVYHTVWATLGEEERRITSGLWTSNVLLLRHPVDASVAGSAARAWGAVEWATALAPLGNDASRLVHPKVREKRSSAKYNTNSRCMTKARSFLAQLEFLEPQAASTVSSAPICLRLAQQFENPTPTSTAAAHPLAARHLSVAGTALYMHKLLSTHAHPTPLEHCQPLPDPMSGARLASSSTVARVLFSRSSSLSTSASQSRSGSASPLPAPSRRRSTRGRASMRGQPRRPRRAHTASASGTRTPSKRRGTTLQVDAVNSGFAAAAAEEAIDLGDDNSNSDADADGASSASSRWSGSSASGQTRGRIGRRVRRRSSGSRSASSSATATPQANDSHSNSAQFGPRSAGTLSATSLLLHGLSLDDMPQQRLGLAGDLLSQGPNSNVAGAMAQDVQPLQLEGFGAAQADASLSALALGREAADSPSAIDAMVLSMKATGLSMPSTFRTTGSGSLTDADRGSSSDAEAEDPWHVGDWRAPPGLPVPSVHRDADAGAVSVANEFGGGEPRNLEGEGTVATSAAQRNPSVQLAQLMRALIIEVNISILDLEEEASHRGEDHAQCPMEDGVRELCGRLSAVLAVRTGRRAGGSAVVGRQAVADRMSRAVHLAHEIAAVDDFANVASASLVSRLVSARARLLEAAARRKNDPEPPTTTPGTRALISSVDTTLRTLEELLTRMVHTSAGR